MPIVVPERQHPDECEVGQHAAVRHRRRMAVGHTVRGGLGGGLFDAPPEEAGVAAQVKGVPGLHPGVAWADVKIYENASPRLPDDRDFKLAPKLT